ncbi:MAG: hypothetical protein V3R84_02065 [Acidimicrobiia bacterium]
MDRYPADQLERDLKAAATMYRQWLENQDEWEGFDDDERRSRLRKLAGEVAEVVQELTEALEPESEDEFGGKVETVEGAIFETFAYFEGGQFVVADDDDEEWVVNLADVSRHKRNPGILFPDNDGSNVRFIPSDPEAFYEALEARKG